MAIPVLYPVEQIAEIMHCSEDYARAQLRERAWSGKKIAGRWYMDEVDIVAAMGSHATEVRKPTPESPSGLVPGSRFRRRVVRSA